VNVFPWAAFAVNLGAAAGAALAVLWVTVAIALVKGVHRIVDSAWGIAFAAVAVTSCALAAAEGHGDVGRQVLVTVLTGVWGLRLAVHIAWRARGHGEDPRYARMLAKAGPGTARRNWYALRMVYLLQAALVWLISLPVQAACYTPAPIGALAVVAAAVWAGGVTFEAVGDWQLRVFKADPANRGKIMDRGLWSWTRHPNYFGDFLVWWGLYLLACTSLPVAAATLLSPLLMTYLLTAGSGKALLERHMADRPGYAAYQARTSGFFPRPPRR
jgi:steroid 5-alpha reductase family enzyme